jgi:hypothetical protein
VKQDTPSEDKSSIYHIFERINTGGRQLTAQEIRASIFHGPIVDLLDSLNKNEAWRQIYGPISLRLRDRELILRFLALRFAFAEYRRPMKEFLNIFMGRNRTLTRIKDSDLRHAFDGVVETLVKLGSQALRPKGTLNAAVLDSVMVAISRRLERSPIRDFEALKAAFIKLVANEDYQQACGRATADAERVKKRMDLATAAFRDVA